MPKKRRSPFSTSVDSNLKEKLNNLNERTGIPVSRLVDTAIELLLDYYDKNESTPYRNQFNTRTINKSKLNDKEENLTAYERVLNQLEKQSQEESANTNNKDSDIELNDIFNIDLNQVQDALNTIKSFQIKFNPDLIEKAKNMSLNDFKGEFKKSLDKYVTNQIKDSKIYDAIPPVTVFQSRDEDLDMLNELVEDVASEQIANPQIDTKNK